MESARAYPWYGVEETPGVAGGYPRIMGTRISLRNVVEAERQGCSPAKMVEMWPHLDETAIRKALMFYKDHPERVDEDIARQAEAVRAFTEGAG